MRTITDASKIVGLHRRIIQDYEKEGIAIKPKQTNKYGYWVYDDISMNRLWQIRFYRELGLKKHEIKEVFNDSSFDYIASLENQIELLEKKKEEIDNLIKTATFMKDTGLTPQSLAPLSQSINFNYDDTFGLLSSLSKVISDFDENGTDESSDISDEQIYAFCSVLVELIDNYKEGVSYEDPSVQNNVELLHKSTSFIVTESVGAFYLISFFFGPETEGGKLIDENSLPGASNFIFQAIQCYCLKHIEFGVDQQLVDILEQIVGYGKLKFKPSSREVQNEVKRLHELYLLHFSTSIIDGNTMMNTFLNLLLEPGYTEFFDKAYHVKNAGKYIANALKYYYEKNKINFK